MRLLLVRRCFLRLKNREQSYIIKLDEAVGKFTTSHMKWLADMSNEGVSRYNVYLQDCENAERRTQSTEQSEACTECGTMYRISVK